MHRAAKRHGGFFHVIYVGDGVWDARACCRAGIPFIGVATDGRAARLAAEGALHVFPDFGDTNLFFSRLNEVTKAA